MKIKAEFLSIRRYPSMPDGTPVEPEQQPAAQIIVSEAQAKMQDGRPVGALPVRFILETTAGEAARKVRSLCRGCKHFKRKLWQNYLAANDSPVAPIDNRRLINELRFALEAQQSEELLAMHTAIGADGQPDFDVEHALHSLGFCTVLSEVKKDQIVVHPLSSCPAEYATPQRPQAFYEPKSLDAERKANLEYDEIMQTAAGKR